jgi:N utilization substance protein B
MLNRRHLRIKALQNIFAWHTTERKDIIGNQKVLLNSIEDVNKMYISMLALLVDITEYTANDATDRANKYLPTEEDLNPNQKLLHNKFINVLKHNPEYVAGVNKYQINWFNDPELIKAAFNKLKESKEYKDYLADSKEEDLESSKEIIKFIFRKIVLKDVNIVQSFEESFINWPVDREAMQGMVAKTFKSFNSENPVANKLTPICADWDVDSVFVKDLLSYTLKNDARYQEMISERTKNWEAERIALMDTILMKMAICELMNFPSIPVKVTINEYIDLSKEYSTPKSSTFINGILDKILNDLKKNNQIKKTGRGLVEE